MYGPAHCSLGVRAQEVFSLVAEVWADENIQRCFRDFSADLPLPAPTR